MYCATRFYTVLSLIVSFLFSTGETTNPSKFTIGHRSPHPFKAPSPNAPASHILPLNGRAGTSKSAGHLESLRKGNHVNGVYGLTPLRFVTGPQVFATGLEFGSQSFQVQIDTGSSDTWLAGTGFQCINETSGAQQPESNCMFGPTYTISSTFKRIQDEVFTSQYADDSSVSGIYGRDRVSVAGIPVQNQQFAVVDYVKSIGDGVSSGIFGFGFPPDTQAYAANNPQKQLPYSPILTNLFSKGYVAPLFTLALERSSVASGTAAGGLLAIGGLPPVPFRPVFATAPFQLMTINGVPGSDSLTPKPKLPYELYAITIKGLTYERSKETKWSHPNFANPLPPTTNASHIQVLIDSGTNLIYLPTGIADAVNALFEPPAQYDTAAGLYLVLCSAKAPEFGVDIEDETFFINGKDLIRDSGSGNGVCVSGVNDAGEGMPVLGTVFLTNVLAIFDVGAAEMRFAAREFY